jgi:DNA-binding NarL/FixJ family response regulator
MQDWIGAVRAAYSLEGNLETWFAGVLESVGPLLDRGAGVIGIAFSRSSEDRGLPGPQVWQADPALADAHRRATSTAASPAALTRLTAAGTTFASLSEFLFADVHQEEAERYRACTGFADAVGLSVETLTGHGLSLVALTRQRCRTEAPERRRWARVAAHLGAGLRLRLALEGPRSGSAAVEAVLDPEGGLLETDTLASGARARQVLRDAVLRRERAHAEAGRIGPDSTLELWEGLVAGRWSLLDRFESSGKRFVIALRNDPEVGPPRGLTRRERQVAEYVGMGRSSKEIAYALGIRASAVANSIASAVRKLGLRGRADLASFFAQAEARSRWVDLDVGGERLAAAFSLQPAADLSPLADAEREITRDLVQGWTVPGIAERRQTSTRTVESQVKAIYAKLGVHSRVELCARLAGGGDAVTITRAESVRIRLRGRRGRPRLWSREGTDLRDEEEAPVAVTNTGLNRAVRA